MSTTIKLIALFGLIFSTNVFSQSDLFVASTEEWNFYFKPTYGGDHVWKASDGTLTTVVFVKGKGTHFGEQAMYGVKANCQTKEFNNNNKGWKKPNSGSVSEIMLKKMCSYTPR
jgi:hypothetical protein